jgi:hypothetical protein
MSTHDRLGIHDFHFIYQHIPIDSSKRQIRLLEILPGNNGEPLRCKLFRETLDDEAEYLALSYT